MIQTVLAISPHTDDVELSAGATLAQFVSEKKHVYYVALSDCRDTMKNTHFNKSTLASECRNSLIKLGLNKDNIYIYHCTNKSFIEEKQKIFRTLESLKTKIDPDLVLIPALTDTHQDHKTTADQAVSVFRRNTSILSYEQPWNNMKFVPNFFVKLSRKDISLKLSALKEYESQHYFKKPYFDEQFITSIARTRGLQINAEYAEAYEVVKFIHE